MPSKVVEASALLMGYEVYLKAAYLALAWLCESEELAPTAEQRPKVFSFVISAVDLMCLPRPIKDVILHGEATLLARVREALTKMPLSRSDREALQAAYDRLQASGIEVRRELELSSQENPCSVQCISGQGAGGHRGAGSAVLRALRRSRGACEAVQALQRLQDHRVLQQTASLQTGLRTRPPARRRARRQLRLLPAHDRPQAQGRPMNACVAANYKSGVS